MVRHRLLGLAVLVAASAIATCAFAAQADKAKQQGAVRTMAQDTLARLYKVQPKAKTAVERAAGYAVFSNFGMKILVAGGGKG
jgi:hypothetical protein